MDSLLKSVLKEPERFLSYIKRWGKILTFKDFCKEFYMCFRIDLVGQNFFKSDYDYQAMKLLWNNKETRRRVKQNYKKLGDKFTEEQKKNMPKSSLREIITERKYGIRKTVEVRLDSGKTYKRSKARDWDEDEIKWLNKNLRTERRVLTEMFNMIFKPRTQSSIVSKLRRIGK